MSPKVSIILVNYNGFADTKYCIQSLNKVTYENFDVVVVDNCSTKIPDSDTLDYIMGHSIFIESGENLGFSGGNNIGIKYAIENNADYVLLLNNDTAVEPEFLDIMVKAAETYENVGIVGGKIRFFSTPERLWFGGGSFDPETGIVRHENYNKIDIKNKHEVREITFMTGCLMLIPLKVIKKVGLMDELYFLYAEDCDYSCRVMNAGYKIFYCDDAVIYHKVSASTGAKSEATEYYMTRNDLWIAKKYSNHPVHVIPQFMWRSAKDIVRRRKGIKPVFIGYWDFFKGKNGKREI